MITRMAAKSPMQAQHAPRSSAAVSRAKAADGVR